MNYILNNSNWIVAQKNHAFYNAVRFRFFIFPEDKSQANPFLSLDYERSLKDNQAQA